MKRKPLAGRRDPNVLEFQISVPVSLRQSIRLALQSQDYRTGEEIVLEALNLWKERRQADLRELSYLHHRLGRLIALGNTSGPTAQELRTRAETMLKRPTAALEEKDERRS